MHDAHAHAHARQHSTGGWQARQLPGAGRGCTTNNKRRVQEPGPAASQDKKTNQKAARCQLSGPRFVLFSFLTREVCD